MMMRGVLGVVMMAGLAVGAGAQVAYETSEDGRVVAPVAAHAAGGSARGGEVPFPLTPDVEMILRRQIGGLAIADLNGDGYNDLVAVCFNTSSFPPYTDWRDMIFFGGPGGIETTPSWVSTEQVHTAEVVIGDVTGDGLPDIVTVHGNLNTQPVRIYAGTPTGPATTATQTLTAPTSVWGTGVALADFDGDGDLDIMTTNQGVSPNPYRPNYVWLNTLGSFGGVSWISADSAVQSGVATGDLNADGRIDAAVAKWVDFESGIYYNNTTGPLAPVPGWTVGPLVDDADKGAAIADFDQDGRLDVAFGGDPSRAFAQTSPGVFTQIWNNTDPFSGAQEIRAHDVNGDGWMDLADVHFSTGRMHIYLNRQGVIDNDATWTYDATNVGNAFALGDLNGDGLDDLAVGYSGDVSIRIFYAVAPDCAADLNDDGELDFFDIAAFLSAFAAMQPIADWNNDTNFDFFDIAGYLGDFAAGCP